MTSTPFCPKECLYSFFFFFFLVHIDRVYRDNCLPNQEELNSFFRAIQYHSILEKIENGPFFINDILPKRKSGNRAQDI